MIPAACISQNLSTAVVGCFSRVICGGHKTASLGTEAYSFPLFLVIVVRMLLSRIWACQRARLGSLAHPKRLDYMPPLMEHSRPYLAVNNSVSRCNINF